MAVSIGISINQNYRTVETNKSNVTVSVTASWTYGSNNRTGQCTGSLTIDGTKYSFSGIIFNSGQTTSGSQVIMTKTVNVSHNTDGSKTLACSASFVTGVSSGTVTASASKALVAIPRKSTLSVANGTLGTAQTLTVARQSTGFTHTITYACGNTSGTICTKSASTSISFTPPLSLANQNTSGTSVSITYTITTYNGSTSLGSNSYAKTCSIPSSVKPSCKLSVTDLTGYYDTYNAYIKGQSKLKVTVTPTLAYNSPIASYRTTANGGTYTAASFTTGVLTTAGTNTITAIVTDKRSRSNADNPAKATINVLDYAVPNISLIKVKRCKSLEDGTEDINGEFAQVTFSATATPLNNLNTIAYQLEYKKTSEKWEDCVSVPLTDYNNNFTVTEGYYRFAADSGSSYSVRIIATDNFEPIVANTPLSTGAVMEHWRADGKGMGFGKIGEFENGADFGWKIIANEGFVNIPLEENTDLNDVIKPNTYVSSDKVAATYVNCPVTSGTFKLEVASGGNEGQVHQTLTYTSKTDFKVYHRQYYADTWGEWICTYSVQGNLLWSGAHFMSANQTATLSQKISEQPHGVVVVFSEYVNGAAQNTGWREDFVPKYTVKAHEGVGHTFFMHTTAAAESYAAIKYMYFHDDKIVGNQYNADDGKTLSTGITVTNDRFVLRYVIGV